MLSYALARTFLLSAPGHISVSGSEAQRGRRARQQDKGGRPQMVIQPGVVPQAPGVVYVSFSAEINPSTTESLIATMTNLAGQGVAEVQLLLSTPGGSVMNGINLYNILRAMPFRLVTHNVGNVDSIGNAVFLAGEHRLASPHSTFMFHGVGLRLPSRGQV